ncbi:hypothetical protein MLC52_01420 [Sulfurimonas sp. NW15]|uniref:hypothetical protein n=1 Tax=Sulfurimonas sp. NW15 TaxID=2922729 RepID=UPI003DA8A644
MSQKIIKQAKTFTCIYSEKEDRLLLTVNYQDAENRVDFWLTRNFLIKLLPHLFEYMNYETQAVVQSTQTQEQKGSVPSVPPPSQQTPTDSATFTLTQKVPVLLESIDITKLGNGYIQFVLKNMEKNIYATATLEPALFSQVIKVITSAVPTFSWGINL